MVMTVGSVPYSSRATATTTAMRQKLITSFVELMAALVAAVEEAPKSKHVKIVLKIFNFTGNSVNVITYY